MQTSPEERAQWAELFKSPAYADLAGTALPLLLADYEELEKQFADYRKAAEEGARNMGAAMTEGFNHEEELERKVREFLTKWDAVEPAIANAFVMSYVHGNRYTGPTLDSEIAALRAAVQEQK